MLFLVLFLTVTTPAEASVSARFEAPFQDDFADRLKAARGDVEALWSLANWCEARGLIQERDRTLRWLLKTQPEDQKARELLGHVRFDGQWFTSEKKLAAYRKKKEKEFKVKASREAKAKGWVRYKGEWIDPAHRALLERGWVRAENGVWLTAEDKKRLDEGWQRQDLVWIAPEESSKLDEGLWKCGSEWLPLKQADEYHAQLDHWWRIPGHHFVLWSTCTRELSKRAQKLADFTCIDMERLFGCAPSDAPPLLVLRDLEQYLAFSSDGVGKSLQGLDSLRGTYFADLWFEEDEFVGAGVAYWNSEDPVEDRWGSLWVRHAAAQSFVEALDRSPQARAAIAEGEDPQGFVQGFWEEKAIPRWLRYGAASYAERYFTDPFPSGGNDSLWPRKWSAGQIAKNGGLQSFDELFEFRLSSDDRDAALHLLNQVGLLVAFLLDGESPALRKDLEKFHNAMRLFTVDPKKGRRALEKAVRGMERSLKKNKKDLTAFAGL